MKLEPGIAAIVTGSASGLGAATARALGRRGLKVAVFDMDTARGEAVACEIDGIFCAVDVTSEASIDAGLAHARAAHGQERILVNCAGIGGGARTAARSRDDGSIREYPLANFVRIVDVNLTGTFRCITKSAAGMLTVPVLPDGDRGVIVNTASVAATEGQIGQVAYAASKGGIVSLTLPVARDLAAEAIRVNTIMPGLFETPLLARVPDAARTALAASVPFPKRLGTPAEYATLALALIENGYVNGESIRLDGAIRMAPR